RTASSTIADRRSTRAIAGRRNLSTIVGRHGGDAIARRRGGGGGLLGGRRAEATPDGGGGGGSLMGVRRATTARGCRTTVTNCPAKGNSPLPITLGWRRSAGTAEQPAP